MASVKFFFITFYNAGSLCITDTNVIFLSMSLPAIATPFPIVNAAATVPIQSPDIFSSAKKVRQAVTSRHVTSNVIFTLE